MTTRRRTVFNLNNFLEELYSCFYMDRADMIDDTVQKYKDFLSRTQGGLKNQSINYVKKHPLYTQNELVRSYIDACHRSNFAN